MSDIPEVADADTLIAIVQLSKKRRISVLLQPAESVHLMSGATGLNGVRLVLELLRSDGWQQRFDLSAPVYCLGELVDALIEAERGAVAKGWLEPDDPDGEQGL